MKARNFLLLIICLIVFNLPVSAKVDLKIEGSIHGYYFAPIEWQGSFLGITNIFVVRISKVLKGKENSEFIVVRFGGEGKEYDPAEFASGKTYPFNLRKIDWEGTTMDRLMYVKDIDEGGNFQYHRSKFELVGVENIPVETLMPDYYTVP